MPQGQFDFSKLPDQIPDFTGLPDQSTTEQPSSGGFISDLWNKFENSWINKPLVSPSTLGLIQTLGAPQSVQYPKLAKIGADLASGLTTPLNIGMTAAGGGEYAAGKLGYPVVKSGLQLVGRALSAPVAIEGAHDIYTGKGLGEKALGALELGGGLLGMRAHPPKIAAKEIVPDIIETAPIAAKVEEPALLTAKQVRAKFQVPVSEALGRKLITREIAPDGGYKYKLAEQAPIEAPVPALTEKPRLRVTPEGLKPVLPEESWANLPDKVEPPVKPKPQYQLINGAWQKVGEEPKVEVPKVEVPKENLVKRLIKEEEGSVDPKLLAAKIQAALKKAATGPAKYTPAVPTQQEAGSIGKLFAAIDDAKSLREPQEELYSIERAKRAGLFASTSGTGEKWAKIAMSKLKGEYPHLTQQRLKLGVRDTNTLFTTIKNSQIRPYEKARAVVGLGKLLEGNLPTRSELSMLEAVYGRGFADNIIELHGGIGGPVSKEIINEVVNIPRTMMASIDMSAPFRQGLGLIHRPEFRRAFPDMVKSFGSEKVYQGLVDSIESRPLFELGHNSGLKLTELGDIASREEQFISSLPEKVIPGVRGSNRAYVAFLNKVRSDVFDNLIKSAQKEGRLKIIKTAEGGITTDNEVLTKAIADYVNNASGRGSLGSWEKSATNLNALLFSPRLIASRFNMLNPVTYIKADPFVRRQYLKSAASIVGTGLLIGQLSKTFGAEVNEDPTNTDFMKTKVGNTRLDPFGGFQQYAVALMRILEKEKTSSITGKTSELNTGKYGSSTRFDVLEDFMLNKLNPTASFAVALMKGKEQSGQPFTVNNWDFSSPTSIGNSAVENSVTQRFIPMFLSDVWQMAQEDPDMLLWGAPAAFLGMGLQTYKPRYGGNINQVQPPR